MNKNKNHKNKNHRKKHLLVKQWLNILVMITKFICKKFKKTRSFYFVEIESYKRKEKIYIYIIISKCKKTRSLYFVEIKRKRKYTRKFTSNEAIFVSHFVGVSGHSLKI